MPVKVVGIVLAAGAGRRLGATVPKPLVVDSAGRTWLERSVAALLEAGVPVVYVVVGSDSATVEAGVPAGCPTVHAKDWQEGMGASLRAGLAAVGHDFPGADAVLVMLVDTPGVGPEVVRRLIELASPEVVARAAYGGKLGHPVLIGRAHWRGVQMAATGDHGARDYLATVDVATVECGGAGSGADIDTPAALAAWRGRQPSSSG